MYFRKCISRGQVAILFYLDWSNFKANNISLFPSAPKCGFLLRTTLFHHSLLLQKVYSDLCPGRRGVMVLPLCSCAATLKIQVLELL